MGGVLAGFGAGRDAQLQRRLTPCVYDEQPRLPVGLAVGAADQAPRACDSARGLTGKERAISRFVAPGPRGFESISLQRGVKAGSVVELLEVVDATTMPMQSRGRDGEKLGKSELVHL
jgi:hypothetical protein